MFAGGRPWASPDFPRVASQENKDDDKCGHFYVDNIGVLATSPLKASELRGKLTTTFKDAGLSSLTKYPSVNLKVSLLERCWIASAVGVPWLHVAVGDCDEELTPF